MRFFAKQPFTVKVILICYFFLIFVLFFYSFTQVDLSLTLSRWSVWQVIEKWFQFIGYFQRPLSTILYGGIVCFLFVGYGFFIRQVAVKRFSAREVWLVVCVTTVILVLSYNAFSYDLFNYIFDAKIITKYQQNPYIHKALDFPHDPMLSFMRWTHRTYPYGPIWLLLTVPISYLGMQYFLPTIIMFKLAIGGSFVGTVYFVRKIVKRIFPHKETLSIVVFALNPLVLFEAVVSAHNDIVMMFFTVVSIYFLIEKKYIWSVFLLLLSIGIKFATVFLLPVYAYVLWKRYKKSPASWESVVIASLMLMILPVIVSSVRTEVQPWYFLWVLPFAALVSERKWITVPFSVLSFGLLIPYAFYINTGNWDPPIPALKMYTITATVLVAFALLVILFLKRKSSILGKH